MSKTAVVTTVEQLRSLKASLRETRARVASLERQNKRLLSDEPLAAAEREVSRLEGLVQDLLRLCELAEHECRELRKQLHLQEVA